MTQQAKHAQLIELRQIYKLNNLSSGSGLSVQGDSIFVVGDDSPCLFELNRKMEIINRHLLLQGYPTEGRIPKNIKPDFECLTAEVREHETILYIFGSGSRSPQRDRLVLFSLQEPEKPIEYAMTEFYQAIIQKSGIKAENLNLEAADIIHDSLYLFNRGTNQVTRCSLSDFKKYLQKNINIEDLNLQSFSFELPALEGRKAGFSGSCLVPGSSLLLFTATVEDTDNWYDDGEVLGSYIGVLDLENTERKTPLNIQAVRDNTGSIVAEKLESLDITGYDEQGNLELVAVADNDDGTSSLLSLHLKQEFLK